MIFCALLRSVTVMLVTEWILHAKWCVHSTFCDIAYFLYRNLPLVLWVSVFFIIIIIIIFFFFFLGGGAFCADMCFILPWAYMLNILKAMGMVTPHHSQMNGLLSVECAIYRLIKPVAFLGMKTMHTSVMGYIVFLVVASGSINVLSVD